MQKKKTSGFQNTDKNYCTLRSNFLAMFLRLGLCVYETKITETAIYISNPFQYKPIWTNTN